MDTASHLRAISAIALFNKSSGFFLRMLARRGDPKEKKNSSKEVDGFFSKFLIAVVAATRVVMGVALSLVSRYLQ